MGGNKIGNYYGGVTWLEGKNKAIIMEGKRGGGEGNNRNGSEGSGMDKQR